MPNPVLREMPDSLRTRWHRWRAKRIRRRLRDLDLFYGNPVSLAEQPTTAFRIEMKRISLLMALATHEIGAA